MRRPRNNYDAYWDMFGALLDSKAVFMHTQMCPQVGVVAHLGVDQGLVNAVTEAVYDAVEAAVDNAVDGEHPALRDYFRQVTAAPNRSVWTIPKEPPQQGILCPA